MNKENLAKRLFGITYTTNDQKRYIQALRQALKVDFSHTTSH